MNLEEEGGEMDGGCLQYVDIPSDLGLVIPDNDLESRGELSI